MNYPVNICDEKVIKLAIQLGDVYAVKQWIARGNDVNVKCVSEFFDPIAPLECVVKEYDERETCMNVSRWGLHMHRSTTMTDYQDMARALQSAGAKMTSEIQKKAKESRFGRPPHQGLLDLVDRWEDGALVEEGFFFSPSFKKFLKVFFLLFRVGKILKFSFSFCRS